MSEPNGVRLGTKEGRGVVIATVLGSGISFLDGLVVNIALPKIDAEIDLGIAGTQWVVSGYLLTLSALLLLGGALGDMFGRRRIYLTGLIVFVISSMVCGVSPNATSLVIARALQGIGGALMVPASLAIIQAVFIEEDRGKAIGQWTGLSTVFTAIGPFVGGIFVTYISWRWAFFINLPLGIVAWFVSLRFIPESKASTTSPIKRIDWLGATLCAFALSALTYWGIESSKPGSTPTIIGTAGVVTLIAFIYWEHMTPRPMMPLRMFRSVQFTWINICTVVFYGAFVGGSTFLGIQLQVGLHYTPLGAAIATLPVSGCMVLLSGKFGELSQRIGPKIPMAGGQLLVGISLALMAYISSGDAYVTYILPCILLWGLGLSMVVAPLTSSALAAADHEFIGVASAVNNAASRVGQSFVIALLPVLAGIGGGAALDGPEFQDGYPRALLISAGLCFASAVIAYVFVSEKRR